MATVKLYLDRRAVKDGTPAPLKLAITEKGSTAYLKLNVKLLPTEWDPASEKVTSRPDKAQINSYTLLMKARAMGLLNKLNACRRLENLTSTQIKERIRLKLGL